MSKRSAGNIIDPLVVKWHVERDGQHVALSVVFADTQREYEAKQFRLLQISLDVKGTLEFADALAGTANLIRSETG